VDNETLGIISELASSISLTSILAYLMFYHMKESKRLSDNIISYLEKRIEKMEVPQTPQTPQKPL